MYNVSEEYLKAISNPVRTWKIRSEFSFSGAPNKVFDDSTIIGDPMIESQAVSGSSSCGVIDIGAAPCATASLTVIDEDANLRKYADAKFTMWVYLLLESGEYEPVLMGTFYCDTSKMSRTGSQINVYAYDGMSTLNYTLTDSQREELNGCTIYQVVTALVQNAKCGFVQSLSGFPNADYKLDLTNTQVRTARDCIMWCAQLMGCFARVNRRNYLEFVPILSTWEYFNEEHTLGTIISARDIGHKERYRTTFSDDRIHIVGVSMSDDNNNPVTLRFTGLEDDSNVIIALEKNPLFRSSEYSLATALNNILNQLRTTYFYAFDAEIRSDPALDAGDTVRLTGGMINGTNKNNDLIGFITHNIWRYRSKHEIINTGQTPVPSTDDINIEAPRSQTDKLLESIRGSSDRIYNGTRKLRIVPDAIPGVLSGPDEMLISVYDGIVNLATKRFRLNVNPGNLYIEGDDGYGTFMKAEMYTWGVKYTTVGSDGKMQNFDIFFDNPMGLGPGVTIRATNSVSSAVPRLTICEQGLYFNNSKIAN